MDCITSRGRQSEFPVVSRWKLRIEIRELFHAFSCYTVFATIVSSMLPPSRVLIIRINFAQMIYSRIMQCSQSGIHGLNPTAS